MNPYFEFPTPNYARHDPVQGFVPVMEDRRVAPVYEESHVEYMGPWGWQWRYGVRNLVSLPPPDTPVTIGTLMDDIERVRTLREAYTSFVIDQEIQDAPGTYRTITDLAYSRSPECPFIVDEVSMASLRGRLHRYENQNTLLSPDAQIGVRKSIAAALGDRKSFMPVEEVHAVVHPYSVDAERLVDELCGPRLHFGSFPVDEFDSGSGTTSMDMGTEDDMPPTPSDLLLPQEVFGSGVCEMVVDTGKVDIFPGWGL